ncbi:hypothetical protein AB4238_13540 [Shewanella sp. 10N.286.45.A1]|uniref:hypothetical protein n=1 Tax=Shewanella sp. 10N.286.45.A1 TaxID=3229694 RepID=UPI00354D2845
MKLLVLTVLAAGGLTACSVTPHPYKYFDGKMTRDELIYTVSQPAVSKFLTKADLALRASLLTQQAIMQNDDCMGQQLVNYNDIEVLQLLNLYTHKLTAQQLQEKYSVADINKAKTHFGYSIDTCLKQTQQFIVDNYR